MQSLSEIQQALRLALASDVLYGVINARVALRTGIDLRNFDMKDNRNDDFVKKVIEALESLGFTMQSLQAVASKNAAVAK